MRTGTYGEKLRGDTEITRSVYSLNVESISKQRYAFGRHAAGTSLYAQFYFVPTEYSLLIALNPNSENGKSFSTEIFRTVKSGQYFSVMAENI